MPCRLMESEAPCSGGGRKGFMVWDSTGAARDCSTEHFPGVLRYDSQQPPGWSYPPHLTKGETEAWGRAVRWSQKAPWQVDTGLGTGVVATA